MPEPGGVASSDLFIAIIVLETLLVLSVAVAVATFVLEPRMRLKRRMALLDLTDEPVAKQSTRAANPRQRQVQEKLKELSTKGKKRKRRDEIRLLLVQAGVDTSVRNYLLVVVAVAVAAAGIGVVSGLTPAVALFPGLLAAYILPRAVLRIMARNRQKQFTARFADAIDIVVRGVKSGLPVGECLMIVANELPDPIGEEFDRLVEGQKLGITLEELIEQGIERMPTAEFKFFAIVLQIQQQTGGSLAETLENLSTVLRERKKMRDKIQAMSQEAKSNSTIIGILPFLVAGLLSAVKPDYLTLLFEKPVGNFMLIGALCWMALGGLMMKTMINFKI